MSLAIRKTFGEPVSLPGVELYTYPSPARLAAATEKQLRDCKLGFRAKYLIGSARMIAEGKIDLERIAGMDDAEALVELCRLPGIGEKVANCVLLFAYGRLKAFPIDVWIERVLREIYFKGKRKVTAKRLKHFLQEYFGPYGGYAQQYLFHHARKTYRPRRRFLIQFGRDEYQRNPFATGDRLLPQADLSATTCVVFDVLRATSSMITALANGAGEILPVLTIEEALAAKRRFLDAVLGGERMGDRIDGFDIGNSPLEYRDLAGRRIITTTTNGTVALRACENAERVLVGALLNLDALIAEIASLPVENLAIICAGTFRELALEDVIAAGVVCSKFPGAVLSDAAVVALDAFQSHGHDLADALRQSRNGKALAAAGRDLDVQWCAKLSIYDTVGHMQAGKITKIGQNTPKTLKFAS